MEMPVDWLLEGEPFVEYRTRLDLLGQSENDPAVRLARKAMLEDPRVVSLVANLKSWPGRVIESHKSASQPFHRLGFLVELGLRIEDEGVGDIVRAVMAHQSEEGPFQLPMEINKSHGGNARTTWSWALCDAPLIVHALATMGLQDDPRVRKAADYLVRLVRDNGWPCTVSKELGRFRGPGHKEDSCPFATLAMLEALSCFGDLRDGDAARLGASSLLALWTESESKHPYMFYMGTNFRKLKAPFVWYDLMHVLDVLVRFPWLSDDRRLYEMAGILEGKADTLGRFTPESVWMPWSDWEFGQKREPSRWLTLLAWRILRRA